MKQIKKEFHPCWRCIHHQKVLVEPGTIFFGSKCRLEEDFGRKECDRFVELFVEPNVN